MTARKLEDVSDKDFKEAILASNTANEACDILGIARTALYAEFARRGMGTYSEVRGEVELIHSVPLVPLTPKPARDPDFKWTPANQATLVQMAVDGFCCQLIAEAIGTTKNAVIGRARRTGVSLGSPDKTVERREARRPRRPRRKIIVALARKAQTNLSERKARENLGVRGTLAVTTVIERSMSQGPMPRSQRPWHRPESEHTQYQWGKKQGGFHLASNAKERVSAAKAKATRESDRALIDAAIAAGKITKLPPGRAFNTDPNSFAWELSA